MHIADPTSASSAPTASSAAGCRSPSGAALAQQLHGHGQRRGRLLRRRRRRQGAFHEAVNLAAVWELPVVFFCENNGYGIRCPPSSDRGDDSPSAAAAYGVAGRRPSTATTSQAVHDVGHDGRRAGARRRRTDARGGETYRWHGHSKATEPLPHPRGDRRVAGQATRSCRSRAWSASAGPAHRRRDPARGRDRRPCESKSATPSGAGTRLLPPPTPTTLSDLLVRPSIAQASRPTTPSPRS